MRRKNTIKNSTLVLFIIFVDQFCKFMVLKTSSVKMGGFWEINCNTKIALSIPLEGLSLAILWILSFLFLLWLARSYSWNVWLLMVVGGALSNLLDRIRIGCVIDYISIGSFPVFNIADIFISVGIIFFLFFVIKPEIKL